MNERLAAWYVAGARELLASGDAVPAEDVRIPESVAVEAAPGVGAWVTVQVLIFGPLEGEEADAAGVPVDEAQA